MSLYFITGNKNKLAEVSSILGEVEQMDIDLPEVQDIDAREIVKAKLLEALNHKEGEFIVEDTSLYLDCLGGLPGPLIKWFMKTLGNEGIYDLCCKYGDYGAEAKTFIGYAKSVDEIYYFEGSVRGKIVEPVAESSFGWDPIFQAEGFDKSFAELSMEEKNSVSMRKVAVGKLKEFLEK